MTVRRLSLTMFVFFSGGVVGGPPSGYMSASEVGYRKYLDVAPQFAGRTGQPESDAASTLSGLSEDECKDLCTTDPMCDCVTYARASGKCVKREACNPSDFRSNSLRGFDVYVKFHRVPTAIDEFEWIRNIAAGSGGKYFLQAKTYLIDRQYQLPPNTEIYGAGSGGAKTIIKAVGPRYWRSCNEHAVNRKGFLLGDNTYVGGLHFVGMEDGRLCDNQLLCGGAPFETPGCAGTGWFEEAPETCGGDLGLGRGVTNATVEDVTIEAFTVQNIFYAAPTKRGASVSKDITIRKVVCNGTWADGLNIHGGHQNVLVEDCEIRNTGDDVYAIWSVGVPGADNITFRRNVAANPWFRPGCTWFRGNPESNYCFANYGGKGSTFLNSTCTGAKYVVSYGNILHKTYGGTFTNESSTLVRGVRGMEGYPCYFGVEFPGTVVDCTADGF